MALHQSSSLFYKQEGYSVGAVKFDLLISEQHTLESEVTSHPIETGAEASDHVRNLPRKGSLVGLVTNFPLNGVSTGLIAPPPAEFMAKLNSLGGGIAERIASLNPLTAPLAPKPTMTAADYANLPRPKNRAADAWGLFKSLRDARQPVIISTGLEKYLDVIVTKVSTMRDKDTGDALKFTVDFQEINFVTLSSIEITTTTQPLPTTGGKPRVSKGKVGGKVKAPPKFISYNGRITTMELSQ